MSDKNTVGLAFKEAAMQAEAELTLTEESTEPVSSDAEPEDVLEVEQPTVESQEGVFDGLLGDDAERNLPHDGELYEVKVDGEVLLVTLDEALKGYMRQAHYTQGRQELAEREREAEKALTLMRMLEERPADTVRKLYQEINRNGRVNLDVAPAPQEPAPAVELEKLVEERVNAILANDPRLAAVQQEAAFSEIDNIFTEIEKMYDVKLTDSDKEQTLKKAVELDTDDLKFVFGGLMHRAQQVKLAAANVKAASSAKPQSVNSDAVVPATPKKYDSFRSALREAWAAEQGPETITAL